MFLIPCPHEWSEWLEGLMQELQEFCSVATHTGIHSFWGSLFKTLCVLKKSCPQNCDTVKGSVSFEICIKRHLL